MNIKQIPSPLRRLVVALVTGVVAILLNTGALAVADLIQIATAHGGLLKLLVMLSDGTMHPPHDHLFQFEFHIVVGLLMALFYVYALERRLPGPPWIRGLTYAVVVWLVNAAIVLPTIGEGFAGSRDLTAAGMLWFAGSHTLFFVLTAELYAHLSMAHILSRRALSS